MKWFLFILIFLVFVTPLVYAAKGVAHLDIMKERYKRALDAGADAAARYRPYTSDEWMLSQGTAFGVGKDSGKNIQISSDESLKWFYRVFFKNIGLDKSPERQQEMKKYIPLKAIVGYDRLQIANVKDEWVINEYYDIVFKGTLYRFTLSDQVQNLQTGMWGRDVDFGISPDERSILVNDFINGRLNAFLNQSGEAHNTYRLNMAVSDMDSKRNSIDGVNFIVFVEGLPLPSLNPWRKERFYAFSLGGSEVSRKSYN